jgi:hypothetical protein
MKVAIRSWYSSYNDTHLNPMAELCIWFKTNNYLTQQRNQIRLDVFMTRTSCSKLKLHWHGCFNWYKENVRWYIWSKTTSTTSLNNVVHMELQQVVCMQSPWHSPSTLYPMTRGWLMYGSWHRDQTYMPCCNWIMWYSIG